MSSIGKALITAVNSAKNGGLVTLQASPDVAALRKRLKLSQSRFAEKYHINPETIKKWEQHKREPDSISRAYLKCIEQNPKIMEQLVNA